MEALKMERQMDNRNDDRLDELGGRMDDGFAEVDQGMKEGFAKVATKSTFFRGWS